MGLGTLESLQQTTATHARIVLINGNRQGLIARVLIVAQLIPVDHQALVTHLEGQHMVRDKKVKKVVLILVVLVNSRARIDPQALKVSLNV